MNNRPSNGLNEGFSGEDNLFKGGAMELLTAFSFFDKADLTISGQFRATKAAISGLDDLHEQPVEE